MSDHAGGWHAVKRFLIMSVVATSGGCNGALTTGSVSSQADGAVSSQPDAGFSSLPANWSCLDAPIPGVPSGNVELELFLNDSSNIVQGSSGTPVAGAQVQACALLDTDCMTPVSDTTSDDAGTALLSIPPVFIGYYQVTAPDFTSAILARPKPYSNEYQAQGLTTSSLLSAGASLVGVTQASNLSIAIVTVLDCTSTPSAGIVVSVADPGANERAFYLESNVPTVSATQTDSVSGAALVFNVPPGNLTVTASFAATSQAIQTVSTIARDGWITYVEIRPDQATHQGLP
jgi:hypothetical protein